MPVIIADENIPLINELFSHIGEIILLPGREIDNRICQRADILLTRSVTKINDALLKDTPVRFVGVACTGIDHVDTDYLNRHHIGFASAAGANANSVAEYVMASLLTLHHRRKIDLDKVTLGIVGVGNIGSRIEQITQSWGIKTCCCDPIRAQMDTPFKSVDLQNLLSISDIISLHVPLTSTGSYPTHYMIDQPQLDLCKQGAGLINMARGKVVNEAALKKAIKDNKMGSIVLDVWENEPDFDTELITLIELATPHIAGYSWEGKIKGVLKIYTDLCGFLGISDLKSKEIDSQLNKINPNLTNNSWEDRYQFFRQIVDIEQDDQLFRSTLQFDEIRKHYRTRREVSSQG